jgi:hypothetical protein
VHRGGDLLLILRQLHPDDQRLQVPGGDGYPNVSGRAHTQDLLDQDLADYLAAQPGGVISPAIQGRVHCTDSDPGTAPACPPGSP